MNLRDIKGTVPIPGSDPALWPWIVGAVALIALIAAVVYFFIIKREKPPPVPVQLSEPERALQTMRRSLETEDAPEVRARMVCPTLRRLLREQKFPRAVMELYTSLPEGELPALFTEAEKQHLLKICEIVSYTPSSLNGDDAQLVLEAVERFLSFAPQPQEAVEA